VDPSLDPTEYKVVARHPAHPGGLLLGSFNVESGPKHGITLDKRKPHTSNYHIRGTFGTGEVEWYTPREYVDAAREVLGAIDLDPATSAVAQRTIQASRFFTREDDGLQHEWHGRVWLNPPYARGGNADAWDGFRRLAGDYIIKRLSTLAPEGPSERNMLSAQRFRGFVEDNKTALRDLFGGQGINTLDAIAANMRRSAQRSVAAAGSDTVPKALAVAKEGLMPREKPHMSLIGGIIGEHLPEIFGVMHPAVKIATTSRPLRALPGTRGPVIGGATLNILRSRLRAAGMRRESDLMVASLLHPQTVGARVLAFAKAEKPTGLMARQLSVALQSLVAANQPRGQQPTQ
jgi:hypothetical protein